MAKKTPDKKTGVIVRRNSTTGELRYYGRIKFKGKECILTPALNTAASASHKYQEAKADIRRGKFVPPVDEQNTGVLVQEFIDRYMRDIDHKKTAHEEKNRAFVWGDYFKDKDIDAVTPEALLDAKRRLKKGEWPKYKHLPWRMRADSTCNRYFQWLHQMFNHPANQDILKGRNPMVLDKHGERQPPITVISEEEEWRIAAHLAKYDPMAVKRFRLAILTGMRAGEQFERPKADVDLQKGWILIPAPKRPNAPVKRPRYIILSQEALDIVRELMQTPGKWLIPHLQDPSRHFDHGTHYKSCYRRAVKAAGLGEEITWHTLRHTWATRFLEEYPGADGMRALMEAGGWSDFKMVVRYSHFNHERIRAAQEAMSKKGGTKAERPISANP